ncbi:hypothetical protein TcCL_Unassigned02050 [Trypanosoma cruzi]|nr:hypothetical protein TcCL_Unassigned02050 [Trypanosoma cruzi]
MGNTKGQFRSQRRYILCSYWCTRPLGCNVDGGLPSCGTSRNKEKSSFGTVIYPPVHRSGAPHEPSDVRDARSSRQSIAKKRSGVHKTRQIHATWRKRWSPPKKTSGTFARTTWTAALALSQRSGPTKKKCVTEDPQTSSASCLMV